MSLLGGTFAGADLARKDWRGVMEDTASGSSSLKSVAGVVEKPTGGFSAAPPGTLGKNARVGGRAIGVVGIGAYELVHKYPVHDKANPNRTAPLVDFDAPAAIDVLAPGV